MKLFDPLVIREITFKNRLAMSPMVQYQSENGFAGTWHLVHYGSRAVGGSGLIIQEATAVSPEGRITPGDLGIYLDEHIEKYSEITKFIRSQGAVPGIQLAHAGRKAACATPWNGGSQIKPDSEAWKTVAPSAIAFQEGERVPEALDRQGIKKVLGDFKNAAARSVKAGFKVIEIHAAHGYLIHEFLSPISNQREDEYGGSFENRIRLLLEIVSEVRSDWPLEYPLFVRISVTDWAENGWTPDEAVKLAAILRDSAVDLIDCSSGGLVPFVRIPVAPGYQVPFAERIRKETGILTGAVGLITDANQANEIIEKGKADMVIVARELLRNPYFPLHAALVLNEDTPWPKEYLRARN